MFFVCVNSVSGQITQPTAWTKAYDQASLTSSTNFAIAAGSNRVLVVGISTAFTDAGVVLILRMIHQQFPMEESL